MRAQIVRRKPSITGTEVSVLITSRKRGTRTVTVDVLMPPIPVSNVLGWRQDIDGNWRRPFRMTDGKWEFHLDPTIKWATREPTDDELLSAPEVYRHIKEVKHYDLVDHLNEVGFGEYSDPVDKVRIVPLEPPIVDPRSGMVRVKIEAFDTDTNERLYVDDGVWTFDNPPQYLNNVIDPAGRFKKELTRRVREMQ